MAKRGRKTLFREEIISESERMAGYGLTEEQIANVFRVKPCTLIRWKRKHPEFNEALKRGSAISNEAIINSLYHNAIGGKIVSLTKKYYKDGMLKEEIESYSPPNVSAQIFWLKNKAGWRDRHEVKHDGIGDTSIHVHPQKVLIFKDLKKEEHAESNGRTDGIHVSEGAESSRLSSAL